MVRFTSLVVAVDANRIMFGKKCFSKTFELNVFLVTSDFITVTTVRITVTTVTTGKNFRIIHVNLNIRRIIDSQLHVTIFNTGTSRTESRHQKTI